MILESLEQIKNEKGISLVELVVAVSIFSLVMIAATGIFISAMKAQKVIIAKQNIANNMRYVIEFMTKEIRMAQVDTDILSLDMTFNDGSGNPFNNSLSSSLSFINYGGEQIKYYLYTETDVGGDIIKSEVRRTNITTPGTADDNQPISSNEVFITDLKFTINGWDLTNGPAPLITIFMKAKAINGMGGEVELQTSISPRTY